MIFHFTQGSLKRVLHLLKWAIFTTPYSGFTYLEVIGGSLFWSASYNLIPFYSFFVIHNLKTFTYFLYA